MRNEGTQACITLFLNGHDLVDGDVLQGVADASKEGAGEEFDLFLAVKSQMGPAEFLQKVSGLAVDFAALGDGSGLDSQRRSEAVVAGFCATHRHLDPVILASLLLDSCGGPSLLHSENVHPATILVVGEHHAAAPAYLLQGEFADGSHSVIFALSISLHPPSNKGSHKGVCIGVVPGHGRSDSAASYILA